jgi:hypothetical protein
MSMLSTLQAVPRLCRLALEVARLPRARLAFHLRISPPDILAAYNYYTKPHPRFWLVRNKSLGIALLNLADYPTPGAYLDSVKKKDYAAYHGKRASARGYATREIDRNAFIEEIHQINTSESTRQGEPMADHYIIKKTEYQNYPNLRCFGAFDSGGTLVSEEVYLQLHGRIAISRSGAILPPPINYSATKIPTVSCIYCWSTLFACLSTTAACIALSMILI